MAAIRKRTRAERRNRARNKLKRRLKNESGFPTNRNQLRFLVRFLSGETVRNVLGEAWCDGILTQVKQLQIT